MKINSASSPQERASMRYAFFKLHFEEASSFWHFLQKPLKSLRHYSTATLADSTQFSRFFSLVATAQQREISKPYTSTF
ncbi:hypothetical protein MKJ04_17620 [Pontibacter sp. E15-1]|uniref:hypothetical protein n=1 Tax=Pontibacter sp. E15-1 TaxID=2919918 RepID=UPI001F4FAD64|nr:hypothetical protein [Pontibacter sp. E15-1]MCJ8166669.1 hypothetical protein [Pontibacter sp. E15-1]